MLELIISILGFFILFVYFICNLIDDEHLEREQKRIIKEAFGEKLSVDDLKGDNKNVYR